LSLDALFQRNIAFNFKAFSVLESDQL